MNIQAMFQQLPASYRDTLCSLFGFYTIHFKCLICAHPPLTWPELRYSSFCLHITFYIYAFCCSLPPVSLSLYTFLSQDCEHLKVMGLTPILPVPCAISLGLSLGLCNAKMHKWGFCGSWNRHPHRLSSGCFPSARDWSILPFTLALPTCLLPTHRFTPTRLQLA